MKTTRHGARRRILRLTRTLVLSSLTLASMACGDAGTANENDAIRSSRSTIGDTLVVRTTGAIPNAGTHTLTELWRVGDVDGADSTITFGGINAFALNADGTVAVFDFTGPILRTYSANGEYLSTIGRKGAGPGEYTQSNGLAYLADGRLAFWDPATARITLYNGDGSVHGEWKPPVTGMWMPNALQTVKTHALAIESTLPQLTPDGEPPPSGPRPSAYFLYNSAGTIIDTLFVPLPTQQPATITAGNQNMSMMMGVPFAPSSHSALLPDGRLALAYGSEYIIRLSDGVQPMRIERDAAVVATTDDERTDARERLESQVQNMLPDWRWDGPSLPTVKPAIRAITAMADNRIWVLVSAPGEVIPDNERDVAPAVAPGGPPPPRVATWREPLWYDVYEPNGDFFARIVMPQRSTLLGARGDLVWGVVTDEDDVPFLVHWRITPVVVAP